MREISVFHMEPEYLLGDSKNLVLLEEKLNNDSLLLEEIETDYNQNQEQYKNEYLVAKINHLDNMHFYYWLYLKRYFDQALYTETTTFPNYQKEEMRKLGWMFPQAFINRSIKTSGDVKVTTEELYIKHFDMGFDALFNFPISQPNSRIDRYYKQAILNYKNQCYYSCAVSLFPIIESYHQFTTGFHENTFYRIKDNLSKVDDKMLNVTQIYNLRIEYYINLVKQFNDLAENHYFNSSLDRLTEPDIINRNRIMHGVFSREISQKDCLQLFCVISNMVVIKNMIDANDRMNQIAEEIQELKNISD